MTLLRRAFFLSCVMFSHACDLDVAGTDDLHCFQWSDWLEMLHISIKICSVKSKSLLFSMACAAYQNAKNNPTILKSITKGQSLMNMSNNVVINYLPTNRLQSGPCPLIHSIQLKRFKNSWNFQQSMEVKIYFNT